MVQDRDTYNGRPTVSLLNGAVFRDLDRPLPPTSRSCHYL